MLRKTLVSIAVSSALFVSSSYALELGELTSQSNMGEPYRGQIELSDVSGLTVDDILVRLGSESEFQQAGLAPTRVLSRLRFNVARENNRLVVNVSSERPLDVDELRFVLAARWPSGQIVREYQAPLNQPVLIEKSQEEVVQSSSLETPAASQNSVFRQATIAAERMPSKGQLNVNQGNTLWSIADQNKASNQLTIYQTMMAIQALNKDAFYSDNINLLKEGAVLRLPTQEQIALFNQSISKSEFQRQHDAWMALRNINRENTIEQAQLNTQAQTKPAAQAPTSDDDKLTLASGQSALPENAASSNAGENQSAAMNALQEELIASQEMLDKEKREKDELSGQLNDLNTQLETLQQLISLKDKQMAELQQLFASAQQSLQEQKNTVDQLLEADQLRREKELAEANSLTNKIFGNPIVVSIGAVVLILLGFLVGLVMRRAGKKQEKEASADKDEFDLSSAAVAPVAAAVAAAPVVASSFAEEPVKETVEEKELPEEDPFAFDFDSPEEDDELDRFGAFDDELESTDFADLTDPEEQEDLVKEFDSSLEDDKDSVEDLFDSFDELDDLSDDTTLKSNDDDEKDDFADLDVEDEEDIPTMQPESSLEEALSEEKNNEAQSEEESFVSSLLDDTDQEDTDESAIFDESPNETLANSIEETLAEAQSAEDDFEMPEFGEAEAAEDEEGSDEEEEFDFFDASGDEVATKLDLARAYMDMGDEEGAKVILDDVIESGNEKQISEAQNMMERMFPSD